MTPPTRRRPAGVAIAVALVLAAMGFAMLGVWQLERRVQKHALIAAVDARTRAAPMEAPGPRDWHGIDAESDAYRHIRATGRYRPNRRTLVRAVSDLGAGYWVIEPLDTGRFALLINRGFIPQGRRDADLPTPQGQVTVTGLLRVTEPGGAFLRANNPAADRWFSRDVGAIARARSLPDAAPYFLDADAAANGSGQPLGGLTVIRFADNHLVYALTWFGMAALSLWGLWHIALPRPSDE
ncbi:MAG: SURF1 family protein [Sphingobium sp.]